MLEELKTFIAVVDLLEELKTFIAVVEIKNFTKAAEYLSLSQPSVSVHIKNLENYFGEKLIDRSFTKAAEYLSLSQPSVSVHIKNLENYFGEKLIDRSVRQKSIKITEQGYLLYKRAKEVVCIIDAAKLEVKITKGQRK